MGEAARVMKPKAENGSSGPNQSSEALVEAFKARKAENVRAMVDRPRPPVLQGSGSQECLQSKDFSRQNSREPTPAGKSYRENI